MNAKLVALVVIFVTNFRICQSRRYDKFSLFSVVPIEVDHLKFLQNLEKQKYIDMIFWRKPLKLFQEVQFVVNPTDKDLFMERARHFRMRTDLVLPDIQRAFDNQTIRRYLRLRVDTYSWKNYHTLEDIYQWLADLALKYPETVELFSIGKSAEQRDIYAIIIRKGKSKRKVVVEAGLHGNEWISTEFVTYLASQLIHSNGSNHRVTLLAQAYNWYLIPIVNPDGYDYSHKVDRLYSKNRRNVTGGTGIDLDRNFDYSFGKHAASQDPNDDNYSGPHPFSEPETKTLKLLLDQNLKRLKFYFSIHSYGQKIIIPYSDRVNHVGDYFQMENYGKQAILKMHKLYGKKYSVGTYYDTMGRLISGDSASWVKSNKKAKHVFTFLLRDNGSYGYALPSDQILPACREAMAGLTEIMTAKTNHFRANLFSTAPKPYLGVITLLAELILLMLK